jgi:hypothetical protein
MGSPKEESKICRRDSVGQLGPGASINRRTSSGAISETAITKTEAPSRVAEIGRSRNTQALP